MYNKIQMKLLIDTSFLINGVKFNIDIFDKRNYGAFYPEFIILKSVINELQRLLKDKELSLKQRTIIKTGLAIIKQKNLKIDNSFNSEYADNDLIAFAEKNPDSVIATTDKALLKRAKHKNIKTASIKQKSMIV